MEFTCNVIKNDTNVRERGLPLLAALVMFDAEMRCEKTRARLTQSPDSLGTTGLKDA